MNEIPAGEYINLNIQNLCLSIFSLLLIMKPEYSDSEESKLVHAMQLYMELLLDTTLMLAFLHHLIVGSKYSDGRSQEERGDNRKIQAHEENVCNKSNIHETNTHFINQATYADDKEQHHSARQTDNGKVYYTQNQITNTSKYTYVMKWFVLLLCVTVVIKFISLTVFPTNINVSLYLMDVAEMTVGEEKYQQCIEGQSCASVETNKGLKKSKTATRLHRINNQCEIKHSSAVLRKYLKVLLNEYPGRDFFASTPFKESLVSTLFQRRTRYMEQTRVQIYPFVSSLHVYRDEVQARGILPQALEMRYEIRRLVSFCGSSCPASAIRLAQSGFYAAGPGQQTRCFSCGIMHSDWRTMDRPDIVHRGLSPGCPHLSGNDDRNIPIYPELRHEDTHQRIYGMVEDYSPGTVGGTLTSSISYLTLSEGQNATTTTPLNLDISQAVYPQYRDVQTRLFSYNGWGWSHVQDPKVLAAAGFYYAGYRDCVRCFYCGVGLRTWEKEDDPWVEHVRWRSSCDYVQCTRGEQFVIETLAGNGSSSAPASTLQALSDNSDTSQIASHSNGISAVTEATGTNPVQAVKYSTPESNENVSVHEESITNRSTNTASPNVVDPQIQQRRLEEENQSLRDESTCKVCLDNPSCIVFLPCGHLVTCAECAPALRKCPVCRALIRGTVRAYSD